MVNSAETKDSQFNKILNEIQIVKSAIIESKQELVSKIEASETKLLSRIKELNKKVNELEEENNILRNKVEFLEKAEKRKNIVLFGLEAPPEALSPRFLCEEFHRLLDLEIHPNDISNSYHFGHPNSKAIKVELVSQEVKKSILQKCKKLKGTKITIAHDLTKKQRENNKLLRQHLAIARKNKQNSFIRGEKLFINNTSYTLEELKEISLGSEKENNLVNNGFSITQQNREELEARNCENILSAKPINTENNKSEEGRDKKKEIRTKKEDTGSRIKSDTHASYKTRSNSQAK